ncbi:MAG: DUF3737 family protein [Firmicutes bacterium]|uniref:DUF3737 family protein n=1 Tax=Candidatus Onthovivens merdipullorum TaxID=2840889 RepID=A0A9D9GW65_9BACL|nr:DUF3737 family protein [Candidatus Onthovivens merdipullorum]
MEKIVNQSFDEERALYGKKDLYLENVKIDGPKDGESAIKECENVLVKNSYFNLRYPFWHNTNLKIYDSILTPNCRAAIWYSNNIYIENSKLHGIKVIRESHNIELNIVDVDSPETGWFSSDIKVKDSKINSEYIFLKSKNLSIDNLDFKGKYSFQYIENSTLSNSKFDTKDAFWHAKNVVIKDSLIVGEYLAWYSENLTLVNCAIKGTQPFCYCKNLKLIDCKMIDTDLAFEKSDVEANIISDMISIKNPYSGYINVLGCNSIILDDPQAKAIINIKNK